jgi:hypothetical protein
MPTSPEAEAPEAAPEGEASGAAALVWSLAVARAAPH